METSLNIVFPVHNVEAQLAHHVERALELAVELTSRFEVLIFDDASSDHTEEVAADLARRYPQVRVIRNDQRLGKAQTIRASMEHTAGDVVVVYEPDAPLSAARLKRLWSLRDEPQLAFDQPAPHRQHLPPPRKETPAATPVDRLAVWAESLRRTMQAKRAGRGSHVLRRRAIAALREVDAPVQEAAPGRIDGAEYISRESGQGVKPPSLVSALGDFTLAELPQSIR